MTDGYRSLPDDAETECTATAPSYETLEATVQHLRAKLTRHRNAERVWVAVIVLMTASATYMIIGLFNLRPSIVSFFLQVCLQ